MRSVHTKKEAVSLDFSRKAGSLCQRYLHKSLANILISKEGAFDKEISSSNAFADKHESNVGFQSTSTFRIIEFFLKSVFLIISFPAWAKKTNVMEFFIFDSSMTRMNDTLKDDKKNDNVRITYRPVPGICRRAKRTQFLSRSCESLLHLQSYVLLRFCVLFLKASRRYNCHERDGVCTDNSFIVRALFPSRTSHVITLILCVCLEMLSHYLTCLCWTFL